MNLTGWVPVAVSGAAVTWRLLPGHCFTHPFFDDTLRHHYNAPVRTTTIQEAAAWVAAHPGMPPTGLVFHMSRCGSTLVAQMLAAIEENRVMSEPPAIDGVLRQRNVAHLHTIVSALGQPAEAETRYFLKVDCWHIHEYPIVRDAFPSTPAVFLFRDPVEVIASQMRSPGEWTAHLGANREEGIANLLAGMLEAALRHSDTLRFIEYTELPEAVFGMFGIEWASTQQQKMRLAATRDAKSPGLEFSTRASTHSETVRQAAERLTPLFERLRAASARR